MAQLFVPNRDAMLYDLPLSCYVLQYASLWTYSGRWPAPTRWQRQAVRQPVLVMHTLSGGALLASTSVAAA
jgi:hypothetical protein